MAHRYFNEEFAQNPERKAHMSVMDGDKSVELPIIGGVIRIPDELNGRVVLAPGWVKYTGQAPASDEALQPITDITAHYNSAKKSK